jgi:hypothetical protein
MARSGPTLHPPVLRDPSDVAFVSTSLAGLVDERRLHATAEIELVEGADIHIPIDSVSKNGSFDAYIHVGLVGGGHPNIKLMVDSGNSTLVLPHFDAISQLPNFDKNYKVAPDVVTEPWRPSKNGYRSNRAAAYGRHLYDPELPILRLHRAEPGWVLHGQFRHRSCGSLVGGG